MNSLYTKVKLFDCQQMTNIVRNEFFSYVSDYNAGNNVAIEYEVFNEHEICSFEEFEKISLEKIYKYTISEKNVIYQLKGQNIIDEWLIENGAEIFENILIKHWW